MKKLIAPTMDTLVFAWVLIIFDKEEMSSFKIFIGLSIMVMFWLYALRDDISKETLKEIEKLKGCK